MKIPDQAAWLANYEDDDDFASNENALPKIINAYARALQQAARINEKAALKPDQRNLIESALWWKAVVSTLEEVLSSFLHDSPARGNGPHEAEAICIPNPPQLVPNTGVEVAPR